MRNCKLLKSALKSSQDHLLLKRGRYKDSEAWLNSWGIDKNTTLQNINHIKYTIAQRMWDQKNLLAKRKLRYYKQVIKANMEDQNTSLF